MKKDRYIKVSPKWWRDTVADKWIHDDNIHRYILPQSKGTQLGKDYQNKKGNKMY
jgi:hypothetical protein